MIDSKGIDSRVKRLETLAGNLGLDVEIVQKAQEWTVLSPGESAEYLTAILDAIAGLDAARAVLVRVQERMRGER